MPEGADDQSLRVAYRRFREGRWDTISRGRFIVLRVWFTAYFTVKQFFRDHGNVVASGLAYTTALSLVPLLSVFISALALAGSFDPDSPTLRTYLGQVFPAVTSDAADYLHQFAETSATSVGGVSAIAFIVVSIFLFIAIERAFNTIWSAPDDRSWWRKMLTFYFIVTFGPVLLTLSVGLSARAQLFLDRLGLQTGIFAAVAPVALTFVLFTLMHNLLPNTRVSKVSAVIGGLFTAIAFELAKWGFNLYVSELVFENYRTIYGALGLVPVLMLWIYVTWIVVLLGAELAYAHQHLPMLVNIDAANRLRPGSMQGRHLVGPLAGIAVLAPIARRFKAGQGATPEAELVALLGYPEARLREIVDGLVELGAVAIQDDAAGEERLYLPAKQLDDIPLEPVVDAFLDIRGSTSEVMTELARAFQEATSSVLEGRTALSLAEADADVLNEVARGEVYEHDASDSPES